MSLFDGEIVDKVRIHQILIFILRLISRTSWYNFGSLKNAAFTQPGEGSGKASAAPYAGLSLFLIDGLSNTLLPNL